MGFRLSERKVTGLQGTGCRVGGSRASVLSILSIVSISHAHIIGIPTQESKAKNVPGAFILKCHPLRGMLCMCVI